MVSTRAAQERLSTGYRIAVPLLFPEQRSHQRRAADSFPARHLHAGTRPATVRHKATTAPELTLPRSGSITSGHSALFRQRSHAGIAAYALPGRRTLRADEPVVAEAYVYPTYGCNPNSGHLSLSQQWVSHRARFKLNVLQSDSSSRLLSGA